MITASRSRAAPRPTSTGASASSLTTGGRRCAPSAPSAARPTASRPRPARGGLGLASQRPNCRRDVGERGRRGRICLPRADLRQVGGREEDVLVGDCTEAFRQVMAFECARAGEHYGRARFLLAEEDRQSLAPAEAMRLIYEQLLRRIMFRHYDVFGPKIRLTRPEKAGLAVAAWVRPDR